MEILMPGVDAHESPAKMESERGESGWEEEGGGVLRGLNRVVVQKMRPVAKRGVATLPCVEIDLITVTAISC